jgi:hypothetical protein
MQEKTNVTVDTLTGFYAQYPGLPSRFRNGSAPGQQTGRLFARPNPPSVAISVGTAPMIAIPVAAFMGSVAMIVGPAPQPCCNHFGHGRPMIAIPPADDCGSLQLCEVGFRYRTNVVFQIQLSKRLNTVPMQRDYMVDRERQLRR